MNATDADPKLRETRTPRTLQSADEAPCGSLLQPDNLDQPLTLRMPSGRGYHLGYVTNRGMEDRPGWRWHEHDLRGPCTLLADGLTETECRHLSGLSAADAIAWCEARDKAAEPRPQPGDVVSWAEVEDDCLYHDAGDKAFLLRINGQWVWAWDPDAEWAVGFVRSPRGDVGVPKGEAPQAILVARDLGFDPEAWRKAMREWTANGNRPAPKPDRHPWTTPLDHLSSMTAEQIHALADEAQRAREAHARAASEHPGQPLVATGKGENGTRLLRVGSGPAAILTPERARDVAMALAGDWSGLTPKPYDRHAHWGDKRIVDPLRQPGLLSMRGLPESTPERVVELTVERIEADRREIERLRAANLEARRALETPGRQGLRARLAKAEAALAEMPKTPSWARVKIASLEAEAVTRRAELEKVKADLEAVRTWRDKYRAALYECNDANKKIIRIAGEAAARAGLLAAPGNIPAVKDTIKTLGERAALTGSLRTTCDSLQIEAARSVDALTAQRDEARRALADEKVKTTRLDRAVVGGLAAQDALIRAANACGARSGTWAELATGIVSEVERLRGMLEGRYYFRAEVLEPLRALVPASAVNAEQVVAAVVVRLARAERNLQAVGDLLAA